MRRALLLGLLTLVLVAWTPARVPAGDAPDLERLQRTHWAFRPIAHPTPPGGDVASGHPIDAFVLERLRAAGLSSSPRADRRTLIRRATFDLIGLPPSWEEVEAFAADDSEAAFAKVVDALLARREYGERWGRHWLDVARYADTKGYVDGGEQQYPFAWTYRDWVIRAFNDDMPYDEFVQAQLAADRLGEERRKADLAALGFLTVGQRFNFFPHEIVDDRIDVVARGLMGLTLGCARCHDHKYDPLTARDYYAMYGVFASSLEPTPDELPRLEHGRELSEELAKKLAEKANALHTRRRELHARIQHEMRAWATDYLVYLVQLMPEHRTEAQPGLRTSRGLLREVTAYGRGAVARWRRGIERWGDDHTVFGVWNRLVRLPREDIAARAPGVLAELAAAGSLNTLLAAALEREPVESMVDVARRYGALLEETETLVALRREGAEKEPGEPRFEDPAREALRQVLYGADSPATFTLDESEDLYHLDEHTDVRGRYAEVERVFLEAAAASPRAMVLVDRPRPLEQRVFQRGDPERPGDVVPRALPGLLASVRAEPFAEGSGRRELAESIVDARNPLTARVIVNRVWAWHFGAGLVATPSDFGTRGAAPTHPELLDWLAAWFVESGWSLKKLHRLILLSSTWQQASDDRPECRAVDPDVELLWRARRRDLDFESMRDAMLAVVGRLEPHDGGPPVKVAPDDPEGSVRTVYCFLDREKLPGVFRVFDFPSPDISCPQRSDTTVPQQALFLLNSPFVMRQAEALVEALDAALPDAPTAERVRWLCRRVWAREPSREELALAERFLGEAGATGGGGDEGALSAWAQYAQVLLESNEFLFVD